MKPLRIIFASFLTLGLFALSALAADTDPSGVWKWMVQGRQGGQGFEQSLKLDYHQGKLTGVMAGAARGQFSVPDTQIQDAALKGDVVTFTITREFNGNKFTTKYEGKIEGDSIKGTFERVAGPAQNVPKSVWDAKRQKSS